MSWITTCSRRLGTSASSVSSSSLLSRRASRRGGHGSERYFTFQSLKLAGASSASSSLTSSPSSSRPSIPSFRLRSFSSESSEANSEEEEAMDPREVMTFDVLIVGGGPAGLAASIRLKQLCLEQGKDLSVCLIDKGSEIGAHILSGNVFDPKALLELFPDMNTQSPDDESHWTQVFHREQGSYATPVEKDQFSILTEGGGMYTIPNFLLPDQLHNEGNYIISLSQLCRWLSQKAEELGVEIYAGFAASEVLLKDDGVIGIATRDVGLSKEGTPKPTFERGVELQARQTLFAEGARGSCSEYLMKQFDLRKDPKVHAQTYGLGIKEVWEVPPETFQKGLVQHTLGFPLQASITSDVFGGTFLYHQEPNLVLVGMVVGLDYKNPYLNPYKEFQTFKTHPEIQKHFAGGTCVSYGARVLNEGGYHAIPKTTFPGGALIGCAAGFLNAVKIKGSHTALKSGMLAAESVFDALVQSDTTPVSETGELSDDHVPQEVTSYTKALEQSWIYDELYQVRNCHQAFSKWGVAGGLVYSGIAAHVTKGREPWTLHHHVTDADATVEESKFSPKTYPAPDGVLTFDLLTNLQRSGTYHADDQPIHLRIKPEWAHIPQDISFQTYAGPEQRFCPAAVYEYVDDATAKDKGSKKLVINSQNCIHCKCCSIKMPKEYINWTVPEGGGGPQYQVM